jgi:hypothetical protein
MLLHYYELCTYELRVVLAMYGTRVRVSHNSTPYHIASSVEMCSAARTNLVVVVMSTITVVC